MSRLKLDENLSPRAVRVFAAYGHDVATVSSEGLQGRPDEVIYKACQAERRCLITLDLGFANILRFPPALSGGIVVLKPGREMTIVTIVRVAEQVAELLSTGQIEGKLWIAEPGRIRIHEPSGNGDAS